MLLLPLHPFITISNTITTTTIAPLHVVTFVHNLLITNTPLSFDLLLSTIFIIITIAISSLSAAQQRHQRSLLRRHRRRLLSEHNNSSNSNNKSKISSSSGPRVLQDGDDHLPLPIITGTAGNTGLGERTFFTSHPVVPTFAPSTAEVTAATTATDTTTAAAATAASTEVRTTTTDPGASPNPNAVVHWDYQIGLHFRCGDRSYIDGAAADLGCTHDGTGNNPHAGKPPPTLPPSPPPQPFPSSIDPLFLLVHPLCLD